MGVVAGFAPVLPIKNPAIFPAASRSVSSPELCWPLWGARAS